jgi:hypothetical protein
VLRRYNLVRVEVHRNRTRYYPLDAESSTGLNDLFARFWKYRECRTLVEIALASGNNAAAGQIAAQVGASRQLVAYHLRQIKGQAGPPQPSPDGALDRRSEAFRRRAPGFFG